MSSTACGKTNFSNSIYLCLAQAMHLTNSGLFHEWYLETIDGINRNWSAKLANFLRYSESGMNCRFDEIINQSLKSFDFVMSLSNFYWTKSSEQTFWVKNEGLFRYRHWWLRQQSMPERINLQRHVGWLQLLMFVRIHREELQCG